MKLQRTLSCLILSFFTHVVIANNNIELSLEEPQAGSVYSGVSNIRGWAVALSGISKVELLIDGTPKTNIPMGGYRLDVHNSFPNYPNSDQAGFSMAFNYSNLTAGNHTFAIRVVDNNGNNKETVTNFNVARFSNAFIGDSTSISLNGANVSRESSRGLVIENLTVEGQKYNTKLEWRVPTQGFAFTQLTPVVNANLNNSSNELFSIGGEKVFQKTNDIVFSLEEPQANSVYSGVSNIRGWAVASSGINHVELLIDGIPKTNVPMGGYRSDVQDSFPSYPNSAQAGFSMAFNYSNLSAGSHIFTLRALDNNGNLSESSTNFNIVKFDNSYIGNLDSVNLNNAQVAINNNSIVINNMVADNKNYDVTLQWRTATQGFAITQITPTGGTGNRAPVASSISIEANPSVPLIQLNLIGSDPDNDTITYVLQSPNSGTGYTEVYLVPQSGHLYIAIDGSGTDFNLNYKVSDGLLYSNLATVSITVVESQDHQTGDQGIDPETYGGYQIINPYGDLSGAPGGEAQLPSSIDLSSSFPIPGQQGNQGSCVGWATAYALKSFQEKIEINWELDRLNHLFSPAFVYNQIKVNGCSNGSRISDALDLFKNTGAVTLDEMPYTDAECETRPSNAALQQAGNFKIRSWGVLQGVQAIKSQLANRQPVVIAIPVHQSFFNLHGTDSVYNALTGDYSGGHAITITGYDDNRYGGAFKIINSWGTNWGDNGYFWLTYDLARQGGITQSYGVEDAENAIDPEPVDPTPPPTNLPNLQIISWSTTYDPRPGGAGVLGWKIANSGVANAPAGARVNLILSNNNTIAGSDTIVVYDQIPFVLEPGMSAYRDESENNAINFRFPDTITPGTYYMALWVDDLNAIQESNEEDNISLGENLIGIENNLPDLLIDSWYTEWDDNGNGLFTYKVINQGQSDAEAGWGLSLMLSPNDSLGDGNDFALFSENIPHNLPPGYQISRGEDIAAFFNFNNAPVGDYYMAVWVDNRNEVVESNERNNISFGDSMISISYRSKIKAKNELGLRQFNGKVMPTVKLLTRKVTIENLPNGERSVKFSNGNQKIISRHALPKIGIQQKPLMLKTTQSKDIGIFPITKQLKMPK